MDATLMSRVRELFSDIDYRCYVATVIGRQAGRAPFGARRSVRLVPNVPTMIVKNGSKNRALLVYAGSISPAFVFFASSQDIGTTNVGLQLQGNVADSQPEQFVLRPEEQLYALSLADTTAFIGQEWY